MSEEAKLGKEIRAFNNIIKENAELRANESAEKEELERELLERQRKLQDEVKDLREEFLILKNKLTQKSALPTGLHQCDEQAEINIAA